MLHEQNTKEIIAATRALSDVIKRSALRHIIVFKTMTPALVLNNTYFNIMKFVLQYSELYK